VLAITRLNTRRSIGLKEPPALFKPRKYWWKLWADQTRRQYAGLTEATGIINPSASIPMMGTLRITLPVRRWNPARS